MTTTGQLSDLDNRIVGLVCQFWNEHQMPLLLSQLGGQENGEIAKVAKQRAGSLGAYLRLELTNHFRVLQHSAKPPVIGVIPVDAEVADGEVDALLDRTHSQSPKTARRFHLAFWTAFRKPLDVSKRRYMSLQAPIHFQDMSPEDQPDGFVEIERKYIASLDADAAEVRRQTQDWLHANDIEQALFIWPSQSSVKHLPSNDLLARLLLALGPDDLKRISMPLDIVNKLRRQKL